MKVLPAASDRTFVVEEGVLDERSVTLFLQGQCHGLALALNKRTGWALTGIEGSDGVCVHVCTRHPDGRLVDVTGAHEEAEMTSVGERVRPVTPAFIDHLESDCGWAPAATTDAADWVDVVLDQVERGEKREARSSPVMVVTGPIDSDLHLRVVWAGEPWMEAFVRHRDSDDWVKYGTIQFPADPETGEHEIDFTRERLEALSAGWVGAGFDRSKAEQKLGP